MRANQMKIPAVVVSPIWTSAPDMNARHMRFLLEGLRDVEVALRRRKIPFRAVLGEPPEVAAEWAKGARSVVVDRGYLRHQRQIRTQIAESLTRPVEQVESDAIVPADVASDHLEYAARTIRPKLIALQESHCVDLKTRPLRADTEGLRLAKGVDLTKLDQMMRDMKLDWSVSPVDWWTQGGTNAARRILDAFIEQDLQRYSKLRKQPEHDAVSHMGRYLHSGHISPIYVALQIQASGVEDEIGPYLEELLVRRELAINFVLNEPKYDRFDGLPNWAVETLEAHKRDERAPSYTMKQLEAAQTEDPYWNAAMNEMKVTGYMHNYMRMYWGKKIIEWTPTPRQAFRRALQLNNKYFLDGRDPNSFANVAWLFGRHDRPHAERPIYGKLRFMSRSGLERKADGNAYLKKVRRLMEQARQATDESGDD